MITIVFQGFCCHLTFRDRLSRIASDQAAFARNVSQWTKPLLAKQPWRLEAVDEVAGEAVSPRGAYDNIRRAMANLGDLEL